MASSREEQIIEALYGGDEPAVETPEQAATVVGFLIDAHVAADRERLTQQITALLTGMEFSEEEMRDVLAVVHGRAVSDGE